MPLLDDHALAELRIQQADAARQHRRCENCAAQIWPNYCRGHDEHFTDGHYHPCEERTWHQDCDRTY